VHYGRLASYTQQLHSISVNHSPNPNPNPNPNPTPTQVCWVYRATFPVHYSACILLRLLSRDRCLPMSRSSIISHAFNDVWLITSFLFIRKPLQSLVCYSGVPRALYVTWPHRTVVFLTVAASNMSCHAVFLLATSLTLSFHDRRADLAVTACVATAYFCFSGEQWGSRVNGWQDDARQQQLNCQRR